MAIAVQQQNQIDVSSNEDGHIVISQDCGDLETPTSHVIVAPQNVEAFLRAVRAAKREAQGAKE